METQSYKVLSTEDEMDSETIQLLQENDKIVGKIEELEETGIRSGRPKLSPEELAAKVDLIYDKLQEIFARARAQNAASVEAVESVEETEFNNETEEEESMMHEETENMMEETPSVECEETTPAAVLCLRNIRESRGWNQKQAAEKLGISQGLISQVESGRTPMSKKLKAKLESLPPVLAA